ncbi:Uma2 family endonuclease [Vulcanococcus sp.]|uniref:Uma2 family endonuclease n=1 Tax=Vulcanococcus sp. TaxID=2856995 RepID=UPI003F6A358D
MVATAPDAPCLEPLHWQVQLAQQLRLRPEQFVLVCEANPDSVLELSADGHLIATTPTGSETSARNSTLGSLLWLTLRTSGLPDGSVLSPDASLVHLQRWQALTPEQQRSFAPLCPDRVVELASPSDEGPCGLTPLRQKMELYRRNGARLGWLLLPAEQAVEIWHAGEAPPQRLAPATTLDAGELFPGLEIKLAEIWQA